MNRNELKRLCYLAGIKLNESEHELSAKRTYIKRKLKDVNIGHNNKFVGDLFFRYYLQESDMVLVKNTIYGVDYQGRYWSIFSLLKVVGNYIKLEKIILDGLNVE